jgi:hypothetical protein
VTVYDEEGNSLGCSRRAAWKGIFQVCVSRVSMAAPTMCMSGAHCLKSLLEPCVMMSSVDSYFYGILTMEVICQSPNSEMAISGYSNSTLWAYVSYEPFHCKEGIDFVMQFQINSVCSNGLFMVPTDMQDESRETGTSSKRLHLSTAWTQDR